MENVGTKWATGEGVSAVLLTILGVAKQLGWIPPDLEPTALIAAVVLVVNTVIFAVRKAGRKGSTPFVADQPK